MNDGNSKKAVKARKPAEPVPAIVMSSGNVFADLGFENAGEMLLRAEAVGHIRALIEECSLKQIEVAHLLGIAQPDVSAMLHGRLTKFTLERLLKFLTILGRDVEIVVRKPPARRAAKLSLAAG